MNGIIESTKALKFVMFSDDTSVYISDKNVINNMQIVNTELGFVNEYFRRNFLTLNVKNLITCILEERYVNYRRI